MVMVQFSNAQEKKWSANRADGHAPAGVMGDHTHHKGEWMVSYRYMYMDMQDNINSTSLITAAAIHDMYMVAPEKMRMQMHMIGLMHAFSDQFTLMAMSSYQDKGMDLLKKSSTEGMEGNSMNMNMGGSNFSTHSSGFGDVKLMALYQFYNKDLKAMHLNLGVSIPSGSIDQRDATPMNSDARLAYDMQLGSGSWDALLGATYLKQYDQMSYGIQSIYTHRLGTNAQGYTLGDKWNATFWTAYSFSKSLSTSFCFHYKDIAKITGKDNEFNPMMAPGFKTDNTGKKQLDLSVGVNYGFFVGELKGLRLAVAFGLPLYQDVNGIQMKGKTSLSTSIQYAFGGKH